MANTYKSQALAAELRDELVKRVSALAVSAVSFDASGDPAITIGTGVAGTQSAFIKVTGDQPLGTDGLGLTPRAFGTHVVQICLETSTIAGVALLTEVNKLPIIAECEKFGTRVELYMTANATGPSFGGVIAANLKATWEPALKWRSLSNS